MYFNIMVNQIVINYDKGIRYHIFCNMIRKTVIQYSTCFVQSMIIPEHLASSNDYVLTLAFDN